MKKGAANYYKYSVGDTSVSIVKGSEKKSLLETLALFEEALNTVFSETNNTEGSIFHKFSHSHSLW